MNNTNIMISDHGFEIDIKKIFKSIKKGIKYIIYIPLTLVIVTFIYVFFIAKPIFVSESTLLLLNNQRQNSTIQGIASQFGFSIPSQNSQDNYLSRETLREILNSRSIAKSILYQKFNTSESSEPDRLLNIIVNNYNINETDSNKILFKATTIITDKMLNIKHPVITSPIYYLRVSSHSARLSADVCTMVIDNLEEQEKEFVKDQLSNKRTFISERLKELKIILENAETKLRDFREQNLQISLSPSLLLKQEQLERDIEIQTQIYISLKQQYEQVKIEETEEKSILSIIDEPSIPIKPNKPKKKLFIVFSGVFGILLGCIYANIKYYNTV